MGSARVWHTAILLVLAWASMAHAQTGTWSTDHAEAKRLYKAGYYSDAIRLYQACLAEAKEFGDNDPRVAQTYYDLAWACERLRRYDHAIRAFGEAVERYEKLEGTESLTPSP